MTLEISGPADAQAVAAYQKALASSGLSAKIRENKKGGKAAQGDGGRRQIDGPGSVWQSGDDGCSTKPGQMPPALELMIYAPLPKKLATGDGPIGEGEGR